MADKKTEKMFNLSQNKITLKESLVMFSFFVRSTSVQCYLIFFYRKLVAMKPKVSLFSQTHKHYRCSHYLVTEENPKGIKAFRNKIKCETSQNSAVNIT